MHKIPNVAFHQLIGFGVPHFSPNKSVQFLFSEGLPSGNQFQAVQLARDTRSSVPEVQTVPGVVTRGPCGSWAHPLLSGQLSGSRSMLGGQFEFGVLTAARKAVEKRSTGQQVRRAAGRRAPGADSGKQTS